MDAEGRRAEEEDRDGEEVHVMRMDMIMMEIMFVLRMTNFMAEILFMIMKAGFVMKIMFVLMKLT